MSCPASPGLGLGEPHGRHFRVAVGAVGDVAVVDGPVSRSGDVLHRHDALVRALVGEQRRARAVADREDAGHAGLHVRVDLDETVAGGRHASSFQPDVLDVGDAPDRGKDVVGLEDALLPVAGLYRQPDAAVVDFRVPEGSAGEDLHPPPLVAPGHRLRNLFILHGKNAVEHLDHRDLRAVGGVDVRELDAHRARAHDHQVPGGVGLEEGVRGRPDALAVDDEDGDVAGPGAGGDDDVAPVVALRFAVLAAHLDGASSGQPAVAPDVGHAVLLEQMADAAHQPRSDVAAALLGGPQIHPHLAQHDAVLLRLLQLADQQRAGEQGLGGDAAHVQANPAQLLVLDAGGAQSELGRADGRDVAARAAADDDHVELLFGVGHFFTSDSVREPREV